MSITMNPTAVPVSGWLDLQIMKNISIDHLHEKTAYAFLEALAGKQPSQSRDFKALFLSKSSVDKPYLIVGLGNALTIKLFASKTKVVSKLFAKHVMIAEEQESLAESQMSFPALFHRLSETMKKVRTQFSTEHHELPFLGGWKCNAVTEELQEMATFTLPEVVLQGQDAVYDLYSFAGDVALPTEEECQDLQNEWSDMTLHGRVTFTPDQDTYRQNMNQVLALLEQEQLSKIVVSRQALVEMEEWQGVLPLIAKISEQNFQEYSYYFSWGGAEEWVGVSPEVLLIKEQQTIVTKPLAGTRKISYGQKSEEEIKNELLSDTKEDAEHGYAVNLMLEDLRGLIENDQLFVDENKSILKTPYAYHIKSQISARVNPGVTAFDVMGALYPPATIWGVPREEVAEVLQQVEPFQRDYFAGGFGYCRLNDDANLALPIRSACFRAGVLAVYAGSGIVETAVPDHEWKETRTKMTPFLGAIELYE